MKRISVVLVLLVGLFTIGCEQRPPRVSPAEAILKGEHALRKMAERTEVNSNISGSFFLFVGSLSGGTETSVSVKFAWEMNDGTYAISSLPLEKVRVRLDDTVASPNIRFRWVPYLKRGTPEIQELMDEYVKYALVSVKESDWPLQVNLPPNKE